MNSSNEIYYPLDFWYDFFGYPKHLEIFTTYIVTPIGIVACVLNSVSFIVLLKQCFLGSIFFSYMKLYLFNGAILSLLCSSLFVTTAQTMLSFTNTYNALFYAIYIFSTLQPIFFLYGCFLEICIVIERSLYFLPKRFKKMSKVNFNKFILILFLFCVLLHIPTIFLFVPANADVQIDTNSWHRIWYIGITDFSYTVFGKVLTYLQYLMRDIFPLIAKIIMNSILVYLVKSYLIKLKREKLTYSQKVLARVSNQNGNYITKTDRNQTYISLIMCVFSIFEHMLYIASYILYFLNNFSKSNIYFALAIFFITAKQLFNILILYKFNSLFKQELKKTFNVI